MTIAQAKRVFETIVDRAYDAGTYIAATNEKENEAIETVRNWIDDLVDDLTVKE